MQFKNWAPTSYRLSPILS